MRRKSVVSMNLNDIVICVGIWEFNCCLFIFNCCCLFSINFFSDPFKTAA